jgi:photosystem II stability/assembly factor-like uncharacterized protein
MTNKLEVIILFSCLIFMVGGIWVNFETPSDFGNFAYFTALSWSNVSSKVVAVGTNGTRGLIALSNNGGENFVISTILDSFAVWDIDSKYLNGKEYFLTVDNIGQIFLNCNFEKTWLKVFNSKRSIYSVSIGSNGNAYAAGSNGTIYSSSINSNFQTWKAKNPISNMTSIYGISTYDGVNVIAVGYLGIVYFSLNEGQTWNASIEDTKQNSNCTLYSLSHGNSSVAIAAGDNSTVLITHNYGLNWRKLVVFYPINYIFNFIFNAVSMLTPNIAFIAGTTRNGDSSAIYRTVNGGISWTLEKSIQNVALHGLAMFDADIGIATASAGNGYYSSVSGFIFINYIIYLAACNI